MLINFLRKRYSPALGTPPGNQKRPEVSQLISLYQAPLGAHYAIMENIARKNFYYSQGLLLTCNFWKGAEGDCGFMSNLSFQDRNSLPNQKIISCFGHKCYSQEGMMPGNSTVRKQLALETSPGYQEKGSQPVRKGLLRPLSRVSNSGKTGELPRKRG
jgi:hypothetical protein